MRSIGFFAFIFGFAMLSLAVPALAEVLGGDLVGAVQTYTIQKGDGISTIARQFDIGAVELLAANPTLSSSKLVIGQVLTIPGQHVLPSGTRTGIVINLAELRLFYFAPDGNVMTFPISIGREGWSTPTGVTEVILKRENPTWTPPPNILAEDPSLPAVIPAGPKNPLGQYALNLGWNGYLIHGTNQPSSIGKPASHGCIRMYPENIATLFKAVEVGTPVTVVDTPFKLGWIGTDLYLEATPTRRQAASIARYRKPAALEASDPSLLELQVQLFVLAGQGNQIDFEQVDAALARHDGVPVMILKKQ